MNFPRYGPSWSSWLLTVVGHHGIERRKRKCWKWKLAHAKLQRNSTALNSFYDSVLHKKKIWNGSFSIKDLRKINQLSHRWSFIICHTRAKIIRKVAFVDDDVTGWKKVSFQSSSKKLGNSPEFVTPTTSTTIKHLNLTKILDLPDILIVKFQ